MQTLARLRRFEKFQITAGTFRGAVRLYAQEKGKGRD